MFVTMGMVMTSNTKMHDGCFVSADSMSSNVCHGMTDGIITARSPVRGMRGMRSVRRVMARARMMARMTTFSYYLIISKIICAYNIMAMWP